jgi:hypothetical protein
MNNFRFIDVIYAVRGGVRYSKLWGLPITIEQSLKLREIETIPTFLRYEIIVERQYYESTKS